MSYLHETHAGGDNLRHLNLFAEAILIKDAFSNTGRPCTVQKLADLALIDDL
jgi:hypothetical protein